MDISLIVTIAIGLVVIVGLWFLVISPLMSKREFMPFFKNWLLDDEINSDGIVMGGIYNDAPSASVTMAANGDVSLVTSGNTTISSTPKTGKKPAAKKVHKPAKAGTIPQKAAKAAVKAVATKKTATKAAPTKKAKAAPKAVKAKTKAQK